MLNLTPHAISVMNTQGEVVTFEPSGTLARVASESIPMGEVMGFPIFTTVYGDVQGVPEAGGEPFLVSAMVLAQLPAVYAGQAFAPKTDNTAHRNEKGHIVHVVGLVTVA